MAQLAEAPQALLASRGPAFGKKGPRAATCTRTSPSPSCSDAFEKARVSLLTDGSATGGGHLQTRKASWSVVAADDWDFVPVAAGRLPGHLQSAARSEVFAMRQAVHWAAVYDREVEIWTDCSAAMKRMQSLLDGKQPDLDWANRDLWAWVARPDVLCRVRSVHKVHSHQAHSSADDVGDRWARAGNDAADRAAGIALRQWFPGEQELCLELDEFLHEQRSRLKCLLQLHMHTAELYTNGDTRSKCPLGPDALAMPVDLSAPSLPPSLRRPERPGSAVMTLPALWQRLKRGAVEHPDAPPAQRRRHISAVDRARDQLHTLVHDIPWTQDDVCAWREYLGLPTIQEVFPFWRHGWGRAQAARWLT